MKAKREEAGAGDEERVLGEVDAVVGERPVMVIELDEDVSSFFTLNTTN